MSATIDRRISELEAFRERQERRKNPVDDVERIRRDLDAVDGQHDLDRRPGENLWDEIVRRMQVAEGWNLDLMPGATLTEKEANVELAYNGKIAVTAEARHAARGWFQIFDYV